MKDGLAVVDYDPRDHATDPPIERCPTGAIVWLDPTETGPHPGARREEDHPQGVRSCDDPSLIA